MPNFTGSVVGLISWIDIGNWRLLDVYLVHGREFDPHYYQVANDRARFIKFESLVRSIAPAGDFHAFTDMWQLFHKLNPDIVHTHGLSNGVKACVTTQTKLKAYKTYLVPTMSGLRPMAFAVAPHFILLSMMSSSCWNLAIYQNA